MLSQFILKHPLQLNMKLQEQTKQGRRLSQRQHHIRRLYLGRVWTWGVYNWAWCEEATRAGDKLAMLMVWSILRLLFLLFAFVACSYVFSRWFQRIQTYFEKLLWTAIHYKLFTTTFKVQKVTIGEIICWKANSVFSQFGSTCNGNTAPSRWKEPFKVMTLVERPQNRNPIWRWRMWLERKTSGLPCSAAAVTVTCTWISGGKWMEVVAKVLTTRNMVTLVKRS